MGDHSCCQIAIINMLQSLVNTDPNLFRKDKCYNRKFEKYESILNKLTA